MTRAATKTTGQGTPVNHEPNHSAKRVATPVSFSTPPIIRRPPYHTKMSHAERSERALSQVRAWVVKSTAMPRRATRVGESQLT